MLRLGISGAKKDKKKKRKIKPEINRHEETCGKNVFFLQGTRRHALTQPVVTPAMHRVGLVTANSEASSKTCDSHPPHSKDHVTRAKNRTASMT